MTEIKLILFVDAIGRTSGVFREAYLISTSLVADCYSALSFFTTFLVFLPSIGISIYLVQ